MRRQVALGVLLCAAFWTGCGEPEAGDVHDHEEDSSPIATTDIWNETHEERTSGKADVNGCSGVLVPDRDGFDKRVALTFDDGPNLETTPVVLDILAEHGAQATFFINGMRARGAREQALLQRMLEEGHILANHSQHHENLKTLSLARVEEEVSATHDVIAAAGATPEYFRFPFGSSSCDTAELVRSFGYKITGWHIDTADWCYATATEGVGRCAKSTFKYVPDSMRDDMVAYTMAQVRRYDGGIVLFHDVHQNTVNHLDAILDQLEAEGFTYVNIDDEDAFPYLNGIDPAADIPWVGTVCESDGECEFATDASCFQFAVSGKTESYGFCTVPCEGFCDDMPGKASTFCVSLDGGETGNCVAKAATQNSQCEDIPGTAALETERFVGDSGAPPGTATVCLPN